MIRVIKKEKGKGAQPSSETDIYQKVKTLRHKSEEEQASILAQEIKLPYADLNIVPIEAETVKLISESDSRKYGIGLVQKVGKKVVLAVLAPQNEETLVYIEKIKKDEGWAAKIIVVSSSSMEKVWNRYKEAPLISLIDNYRVSLTEQDLRRFEEEIGDLVELKKRITELPTTEVIDIIMAGAVKLGASDVHIEPQPEQFRLRYRIDGVLQDVANLPISSLRYIVNRIKMMAKMKINVKEVSQDGKFTVKLAEDEIDIRVSVIPTNYGETVVMRLLLQSSIKVAVEESGLRGKAYEEVQKQIMNKTGMILTSGPTGSGKTTTLYSLMKKVNSPEVKMITIEDPVEYHLEGVTQTQVNASKGYTFANGLRAIVRQDPDVVMVGEIRDEITANTAVQAALTGHLVFSTIHANHAAGIIPRLFDLGIKPDVIPPAVNALVAQRLVRRLCPKCKEEYIPAQETVEKIKKIISIVSPKAKVDVPKKIEKLYRAKGCAECNFIGYKGRVGIFEVMTISSEIEKLILDMAGESEILLAAIESGMITLAQDGILKALEGITSLEEIGRVTGESVFLEEIYSKLMYQSLARGFIVKKDDFVSVEKEIGSIQNIKKFLESAKSSDLVRQMFAAALLLKAGDIHIEPEEKNVLVRFRIDGILQNIFSLPIEEYQALLGKLKELSGLKTEQREGVKDTRFSVDLEETYGEIKDKKVDVRASIVLGGYGETVVMRLLNQSATVLDVNSLGIRKENLDKILAAIKKPNGVVLNTGPTGSGKTTTLYTLLNILNKPEVKIITIEDPIEYRMEGTLQTQVNEEGGYTFATALRALLRQNPDIMMIGEIRDEETAKIAFQAALTGHLVLSTLHTNDAAGSVQRLLSMGVVPSNIASATNVFIAQRLVRRLCDCKKKVKTTGEEKEKIENVLKKISPESKVKIPKFDYIWKPGGCGQCNNIGYRGRIAVSEVITVDKDIQELVSRGAVTREIFELAKEKGMLTMAEDGMLKVVEGLTTLEEVERVTEE